MIAAKRKCPRERADDGGCVRTNRVLVVDDDELIARGYKRLLETRGYQVTVTRTMADAVAALDGSVNGSAYDHVVLDIRLPDGDGENVLVFAESLPRGPGVVVVAAQAEMDARRFASLHGRCAYLPKPIVIDTLIEVFERQPAALVRQYCALHDFSDQETATFANAIEGFDDVGIANEIGCKPTTVRTYWSRIGEKTGTACKDQTLTHFARWLLARGASAPRPVRSRSGTGELGRKKPPAERRT
jgi:DNA-binding NarL/FixJ family response regulator